MLRRSSPTRRLSLEPLEGRAVLSTIVPLAEAVEAINHGVSVLAWARVDGVGSLESSSLAGAAVHRGATIADDVVVDGRIITGQDFNSANSADPSAVRNLGEMALKGKKILQNATDASGALNDHGTHVGGTIGAVGDNGVAADAPAPRVPANRIYEYTPCCDAAHVDFFLKLKGIDGESTDDKARSGHEGAFLGNLFSANPAARADGTSPSGTGTNYFDGRFLRGDDLSGEPAVDRGGLGRDVLLGGDGDDRLLASAVSTGHIGGVNAVLGDGSVRFIRDSVAATSLAAEGEAQTERSAHFPTFHSIDIESTDNVVSVAASDVIFGSLGQDEIDRTGAGGHELGHLLGLRHEFDASFADAAFASLSGSESTARSDPDNNHGTHVAGTIGSTGSAGWVKISPDA